MGRSFEEGLASQGFQSEGLDVRDGGGEVRSVVVVLDEVDYVGDGEHPGETRFFAVP